MSHIIKKRILFVATEASVGMLPFAVTVVNAIAATKLYDIHVISVNTKQLSFQGKFSKEVHTIYINESQYKARKILDKFWFSAVIKAIKNEQKTFHPHIIHLITADFRLGLYIRFHSTHQYCYTVHDLHPHERNYGGFIRWGIQKIMTVGCYQNHNSIRNLTTCSRSQFRELQIMYPLKNIHFTHFPTLVTPDIVNGNSVVKELVNKDNYILFFGSIDKYKGIDLLIEAYLTSEILHNFNLVIAGKDRNGITNSIKDKNIIVINRFIDDKEIRNLYEKAKVVVYPYRSATMSGVLSIAFYFNKRVLLSDIPFFKDLECEATSYFKNGDSMDLMHKLESLINSPSSTAISAYKQYYDIGIMQKDYIDFYESIE